MDETLTLPDPIAETLDMSATATRKRPKPRKAAPDQTADQKVLLAAIKLSGLSNRQFANDVLGRHETSVRRWINEGAHIPAPVVALLRQWVAAGKIPADRMPEPRRDPRHK